MGFQLVCISLTHESEGEKIGHAVAAELGFRYVDEEIISKAAELAGVDPQRVAAAEHKQPLMQRLLDKLLPAQGIIDALTRADSSVFAAASSDELRSLIRAAIREVGKTGNAVIVAHGASMALAGRTDVLRVLVTAPEETRIARAADRRLLTPSDASMTITDSDDARRSYFRDFYKVEEELPTHYDLVLNTELISPELAARLIVAAVRG